MVVFGKCIKKTVGFSLDKHYSFKKIMGVSPFAEDEYLADKDFDYYVANDSGRIMVISEEYFNKYFELTGVED